MEHAACPPLQGSRVHSSQTLKITKLLKTTGRNVTCDNIALLPKVKLWMERLVVNVLFFMILSTSPPGIKLLDGMCSYCYNWLSS